MMDPVVERELREQMDRLDRGAQRQVVDFARTLAGERTRGVRGAALARFGGSIDKGELALIERAVEADCERLEPDEW